MHSSMNRYTWLVVVFCLYFNLTVEGAEDDHKKLSEGTIVALGCLGGALVVALIFGLTCFLVRRLRRKQFLKQKIEAELLESVSKQFRDSLNSSELDPVLNMTLVHNGPVPTRGESVQKYTEWVRQQPQPSPLMYNKRVHDVHVHPDRHFLNQRVFTVPTTTKTVITQRPKYIIKNNRSKSVPPPEIRTNYITADRYGYTNAHFLPVRTYAPPTNNYITKRFISQPQWRQEVIRHPPVQEVIRHQEVIRPPPVQEVIRPPPVQYVETVTHQAPGIQRSSSGSTYHVKLDTRTMNYSKERLGGSTGNILESTTYRDRTYSNPDYVVNSGLSEYKPKVLQGTYLDIPKSQETSSGWRVVRGSTEADSYRVSSSGQWVGQDTEVKTQTAEFGENGTHGDDAVFMQEVIPVTEANQNEAEKIVQKRTYDEVVIVDYVETNENQNVSPLSTSTPRFPERSPIDDVLNGESSGSSSSSESEPDENRRQRNPSTGS